MGLAKVIRCFRRIKIQNQWHPMIRFRNNGKSLLATPILTHGISKRTITSFKFLIFVKISHGKLQFSTQNSANRVSAILYLHIHMMNHNVPIVVARSMVSEILMESEVVNPQG